MVLSLARFTAPASKALVENQPLELQLQMKSRECMIKVMNSSQSHFSLYVLTSSSYIIIQYSMYYCMYILVLLIIQ
jgi:hypothetical protein